MTVKERIRGILEEMFGPERAAALDEQAKPWWQAIDAKSIDRLDFACFIQRDFDAVPGNAYFYDEASLAEIIAYVETVQPSGDAH